MENTELQAVEETELPEEDFEELESAPEEDDAPEPQEQDAPKDSTDEDDGEDPDWYVKAINRQHHKYREEERKRIQAEQRLAELEQQAPQDARPKIPPAPDPFEDGYEQKIAERDQAIRAAAAWETRQQATQYQQQLEQQRAIQERAESLRSTLQSYTGRAESLGIKPEVLKTAGSTIATMGMHDDVATFILNDEKGPLITTYLARHPGEVEAMHGMTPVQAGVYLATKVKPKAESAHGVSQAPAPPDTLDGGGAPPQTRGPKGATFE